MLLLWEHGFGRLGRSRATIPSLGHWETALVNTTAQGGIGAPRLSCGGAGRYPPLRIREKLDAKRAPLTIQTHLSLLRRVLSLAHREGQIVRNPASRLGELMRRVGRRTAAEAGHADSWTRQEVEALLGLAAQHEPRFHPALALLFSTGLRRGELLGLR